MMMRCTRCNDPVVSGELCILCEIVKAGGDIYYITTSSGVIAFWSNEREVLEELGYPISKAPSVESYVQLVRAQRCRRK